LLEARQTSTPEPDGSHEADPTGIGFALLTVDVRQ
jgi:hypothetical protein